MTVTLSPDARMTYRLSGTGSSGATLRVYLERHIPAGAEVTADPRPGLDELAAASRAFVDMERRLGRAAPSTIT